MTPVGSEVRCTNGAARPSDSARAGAGSSPVQLPADSAVATVLLVSDLVVWTDAISTALAGEGFRVVSDPSGAGAFDELSLAAVDVALVDLRLRSQSGLAVCAALRSRGSVPLVALGPSGQESVVLQAYSAGADQYVAVDVSARQLVARLRALLRRFPPRAAVLSVPTVSQLEIDPAQCVVTTAGVRVKLSRQELEVLQALVVRPGRVVPRHELMGAWTGLNGARRLDFVIRRLRHKLEAVDGVRRISVVRGVGFRYQPDGVEALAGDERTGSEEG